MTVVRGDAARLLMARTRSARRQERPSSRVSSWSQTFDIAGADQAGASMGRAAALLRQQLLGTSLAQRHDDVVIVMTELVNEALAASGYATLRLSWTSSDGVLVEVSDTAPAAALVAAAAGQAHGPHRPSRSGSTVVDQLADSWGLRPQSAGTCVWARLTAQPTW